MRACCRIAFPLWLVGFVSLIFACTALAQEPAVKAPPANATESLTPGQFVFTCGHSFHVWVPGIVADLCQKSEILNHVQVGVSSIGGSRVIQHWDIPDEKNRAKAALRSGKVDVLTLSPIFLPDEGIENFTSLALEHNPDIRVMIQPIWLPFDIYLPLNQKPAKVDHNAITGEELRQRHEPYFEAINELVRELNEKYGKTVLYVTPAPQALIALRENIIAGEAPGLKEQEDLFTDELGHGQPTLMALVGYCNYATIYRRSPVGLPVPEILKQAKLGDQEEALNRLLQELAWQAVTEHPLSGVAVKDGEADTPPAKEEPKENTGAAVKAAVDFLSKQQDKDGLWKTNDNQYGDGISALCTLALLDSGVEAQDDRIQRALKWLRKQEPKRTYSISLQTLVYCRAGAPEDVARIRHNVEWLVDAQAKNGNMKGGWNYIRESGDRADGSNTRFAIWALDAARRAKVEIPESVWRSNAEYWLASQHEDGAWTYTTTGGEGTPTMTLAGITCLSAAKEAVADEALHKQIDLAIERAWKKHDSWCVDSQPPYLTSGFYPYYSFHSLGEAATRTGHSKIGDVAWKPAAIRLLLSEQEADSGMWSQKTYNVERPLIRTSLALLFLAEK